MLVKVYRKNNGPGETYVAQAEMDTVPRERDLLSIDPDDASEVVMQVTFCLPFKGHAAYAIVLLRAS